MATASVVVTVCSPAEGLKSPLDFSCGVVLVEAWMPTSCSAPSFHQHFHSVLLVLAEWLHVNVREEFHTK